MRDIKFRERLTDQWDQFKKWHYWGFIDGSFISPTCTNMAYSKQFTGLHDKNGKEIYEGDILSGCNGSINGMNWPWGPFEVRWKGAGFDAPLWGTEKNQDSTHWFEVIGNIHENPELLEK